MVPGMAIIHPDQATPLSSASTCWNMQCSSSQCWVATFTTSTHRLHDPMLTQSTSLSATTLQVNRGSIKDVCPAPRAASSPVYKLLYYSTRAWATTSAASTQNQMSLPTASNGSRSNPHSLTTSQSSSHRPPACLAVGASSPMPPSSH